MKIETKFNLNDKAWYMVDNKPREVEILGIYVFEVGNKNGYIRYNAKDVKRPVTWIDHEGVSEFQLERTKAELLAKL